MIKWKIEQAITFCDDVKDGTHDSPKHVSNGYKLLTSKHITNGVIDTKTAKTISPIDYETINKRSKVDVNDILFSMIGTIGSVCRIASEPNFAIKNMGLFKVSDEIRSKYLYYYLQSPTAKEYIASATSGSTQQYISLGSLRKFPIKYPSQQSDMQRMVEILDSLQKKITLNNRINDYLAQLCEVVVGKYCESGTDCLGDICYQVTDKANCEDADLDTYVSTESLLQNKRGRQQATSLPATGKVTRYATGDTLVSNIRPYFKKVWYAPFDGTCSGDVLVFRANSIEYAPYLHACLRQDRFFDHVMRGAKGTKMPRGDKKQMMEFNVSATCRSEDLSLLNVVLSQIAANDAESTGLGELRATLLPKLMSGEIDVSKVKLPMQLNNHLCDYS